MRSKLTFMVMVAALATLISVPACAGHFDWALLGGRQSIDVYLDVDGFDVAVVLRYHDHRKIVLVDNQGDMTNVGDFELEEFKRSYAEVGIGYKIGPFTPFLGYSTMAVYLQEQRVVVNQLTGKNEIVTTQSEEAINGLVFGVSLAQRFQRLGVEATIARAATGTYGEAKLKYYINDHLALVGAGVFHPGINVGGLAVGLGISY